jgi:hypothetical protein
MELPFIIFGAVVLSVAFMALAIRLMFGRRGNRSRGSGALTTARRIMAPVMRAVRIMEEVLMAVVSGMAAVSEADTIRSHLINAHSGVWRTS